MDQQAAAPKPTMLYQLHDGRVVALWGDGEHDDTEAIQKIIDTDNAFYAPHGVYRLTDKLTGQRPGIVLEGNSSEIVGCGLHLLSPCSETRISGWVVDPARLDPGSRGAISTDTGDGSGGVISLGNL